MFAGLDPSMFAGLDPAMFEGMLAGVNDPFFIQAAKDKGAAGINLVGMCCSGAEMMSHWKKASTTEARMGSTVKTPIPMTVGARKTTVIHPSARERVRRGGGAGGGIPGYRRGEGLPAP